jgi:alkyl sulfatase BDS1-like metallo-beta-lactamase superfamily hydrolase
MATLEECERAFHDLAGMLTRMDADKRQKTVLDRSLSCKLRDLDVIFAGQLRDGGLQDIRQVDRADAQIRLAMNSDDLIRLTSGKLNFAAAWATGKVRVDANVLDLLKLRSLF